MPWLDEQAEQILKDWPKECQSVMRQGVKDLIAKGMRVVLAEVIKIPMSCYYARYQERGGMPERVDAEEVAQDIEDTIRGMKGK